MQIIYVSEALPILTRSDLNALAAQAAINNAADGLTGLLLHQPPRFFGVLEGPCARLLARMEKVATDRRHRGLRILREVPVRRRRFQNWTFGTLPAPADGVSNEEASAAFIRTLSRRL